MSSLCNAAVSPTSFPVLRRTSSGAGRRGVAVAVVAASFSLSTGRALEPDRGGPIVFTDITVAAGIDFVETIGDDAMTNIVESAGVGCGFLDYDGDGWLDIYLVNGCWLNGVSDARLDAARRTKLSAATDRLYRNLGDGTFKDVTVAAGLATPAYGMGVVAADYDGDGDTDIYVTNYGANCLYRNNGDGTFTDVAKQVGVDDPRFSVGAVFLDYDRDGRLDLYVGDYLVYDPGIGHAHTRGAFPGPLAYAGLQDRLFRGGEDGTFTDVTRRSGIAIEPKGRAMGVGAFDYDGFMDVFVSNDAMENFLFRNQGDGTFKDIALDAGVALGENGAAKAAMGVEFADYDGDGLVDIFVPDMNSTCLYRNVGGGVFEDRAAASGIASVMGRYVGWGGVLADLDLDGSIDLYISTGDVRNLGAFEDVVLLGDGRGRFTDVSGSAGGWFGQQHVGRGVAGGDFDNDGDIDILVTNLNGAPALLRNDTPRRGRHWLTVELIGRPMNRDAIGAVVTARTGGVTMTRLRLSGGSYLSQHDHRLHFGLGGHDMVDQLEVTWPDGSRQIEKNVRADRRLIVRQRVSSPRTSG